MLRDLYEKRVEGEVSFLPGELRRYELEKALLATSSDALGTSSFLFLVVWPGATSSFLLLVAMPLLLV